MNVKEMVKDAIEEKEFIDMLEGKSHYKIENSQLLNMTTPNDYIRILKEGIYKVYNDSEEMILQVLKNSLEEMIQQDILGLYCALEIIYVQLKFEKKKESPFCINTDKVIPLIQEEIKNNKDKLIRYYDWAGRNEEDGMYGYFFRMNQAYQTYFGYTLI